MLNCTLTGVRQFASFVARAHVAASKGNPAASSCSRRSRPPDLVPRARASRTQTERVAARVKKNDEVWSMVAVDGAAGTDRFRVCSGLVQIVHIKIEMELLRYRIVRPSRRLVIEGELESNPGS